MFLCEIAHNEKGLISVFQEILVNVNKTFIFAEGLGTRLSFYECETLSWYFLVSAGPKF